MTAARHVAIIMDGNGRWAKRRHLPRVVGHQRGVEAVRALVRALKDTTLECLTLYAFSSENWRRPADEVSLLMQLFVNALQQEVERLHQNNVRFRVIGDLSRFDPMLIGLIEALWSAYFTIDYKDVATFSILAIALIFKPSGILGRPEVEKV